ncbi:MAG: hypothetical protein RRA15_10455 [bacterium]|nr:hypothetical protein [bacterium]MDT8366897.1 hypothetical protein [bacterium]
MSNVQRKGKAEEQGEERRAESEGRKGRSRKPGARSREEEQGGGQNAWGGRICDR